MYSFEEKITSSKAVNRIKDFNYSELTDDDKYFLEFQFPNRMNFISSAIRNMNLQDISIKQLVDIYKTKANLDTWNRSGIATTILYKLVKEQNFTDDDVTEAKRDLLLDMLQQDEQPLEQGYDEEQLLYIIKITIGSTSFIKYGITQDLNKRLVKLRSNIKSFRGYETRSVNISVLHIEPTTEAEEIENNIKEELKKKRMRKSGYYFAGYTETVEYKYFDKFKKIVKQELLRSKEND